MRGMLRALSGGAVLLTVFAGPLHGDRIPAFARKYNVSCALCHAPAPRLTEFGEVFAANGFELQTGEDPRDTAATGDPLLRLMRGLPLAVRFDAYAQAVTDATAVQAPSDLQTPWAIKVLSGGQVADGISYYMYFFLSERGEVAGLEDAYLQFTDVGGLGLDLLVGQFQVSDPLFKRELRLEYEDYQPYRVRVGDARADLTYDRGIMAAASPWEGADLSLQMVNGRGLSHATEAKQYDTDPGKNGAVRLSQAVGPLRVGGFAYVGEEKLDGARDRITIWGPDATLSLGYGKLEVNLQALRRTDDNAFFIPGVAEDAVVDAGFAEVIWMPAGPQGRLALTGLYNIVRADAPLFTIRQGETALLQEYESAAAGASWLLRRNVRLVAEAAWDLEREQARFTIGAATAF